MALTIQGLLLALLIQMLCLSLLALCSPVVHSGTDNTLATHNTGSTKTNEISSSETINQQPVVTKMQSASVVKVPNAADKLKRGLANFISQHNPAPFFVPPAPLLQHQAKVGGGGGLAAQTAVSSNLVTGDASAEAIIKGPNRLVQTRPIGGATRWGRR